jgi:hypothetical protein
VVEGGVPDIEPAHPDATTAAAPEEGRPTNRPELSYGAHPSSDVTAAQVGVRKRRRGPGSVIFGGLKRLWIPLIVLTVIGAGGFTVARLHGIFGSEKTVPYGEVRSDADKPFNPSHLRYEIFGNPGTVAQISYFDGNGDPKFIKGVSLPWTLEFPTSTAASIGSIAAQGDSERIGCRILVDGVVKDEKITDHEVSSFTSCSLKAS